MLFGSNTITKLTLIENELGNSLVIDYMTDIEFDFMNKEIKIMTQIMDTELKKIRYIKEIIGETVVRSVETGRDHVGVYIANDCKLTTLKTLESSDDRCPTSYIIIFKCLSLDFHINEDII